MVNITKNLSDSEAFQCAKLPRGTITDLMLAQEKSLEAIWNNTEDDIWNGNLDDFLDTLPLNSSGRSHADILSQVQEERESWED